MVKFPQSASLCVSEGRAAEAAVVAVGAEAEERGASHLVVARNQCLSWTFLSGRSLQQHVVSSKHCAWAGAELWPRDALQNVSKRPVKHFRISPTRNLKVIAHFPIYLLLLA